MFERKGLIKSSQRVAAKAKLLQELARSTRPSAPVDPDPIDDATRFELRLQRLMDRSQSLDCAFAS